MINIFNDRGKGCGSGPVEYLLGRNYDREHASVLRGNPDVTRDLIDSLNFAKKYTSGTLSFSETYIPNEQKTEIMTAYEEAFFPALSSEQYNILWVQHQDKNGRIELNFLIPNLELSSGKRLNPYFHRVDLKRFDSLKNMFNDTYNYSDPNSPKNCQLLIDTKNLPKDVKDIKQKIHNAILEKVKHRVIKNRDDITLSLKNSGFIVSRETKKSISVKNPNSKINIRLTGKIYEKDFNAENMQETIDRAQDQYKEEIAQRIQKNRAIFLAEMVKKSEYHKKRFPNLYESNRINQPLNPNNHTHQVEQSTPDSFPDNDIPQKKPIYLKKTEEATNDRTRVTFIDELTTITKGISRKSKKLRETISSFITRNRADQNKLQRVKVFITEVIASLKNKLNQKNGDVLNQQAEQLLQQMTEYPNISSSQQKTKRASL